MLHCRFRPSSWDQFAGNSKEVARLRRMIDRPGFAGGAIWIQGATGVGKTTLAWLVAHQFASDFDCSELDGDACNVDAVHDLKDSIRIAPMMGGWKAVIVNESHNMTAKAVQAWLNLLENLGERRIIIFTTTESGDLFGNFTGPMLSRCVKFKLDNCDVDAFAARAKVICQAEGMDAPDVDYVRLVKECGANMRDVVGRIMGFDLPTIDAKPVVRSYVPPKGSALARAMGR